MKKTLDLIAAPPGLQPGGYVPRAYQERQQPFTESASLETLRTDKGWRFDLSWSCPDPVRDASGNTDLFVDAAALLAPTVADAPWISMGEPGKAVEGALWRADSRELLRIRAEGLGSVERQPPFDHWNVSAAWKAGVWRVIFELVSWPSLETTAQLALAIWRGASADRGGLKSISPGWIALES